jgi:hypothetical protein
LNTLNLSKHALQADILDLIEELTTLEVNDPLFILIGRKTGKSFDAHRAVLAAALGQQDVRRERAFARELPEALAGLGPECADGEPRLNGLALSTPLGG